MSTLRFLAIATFLQASSFLQAVEVPNWKQEILAAARQKDGKAVAAIVQRSNKTPTPVSEEDAAEMLAGLLRTREREAFITLLDQMRKTVQGRDWQPDDTLLQELITSERKELLDALLARELNPGRLEKLAADASPSMTEWIAQRAGEVRKQRADQDALVMAAGKGDLESIRRLLDAGVDINCEATTQAKWEGARSHRPLTLAAREDKIEAVKLLLERGAEVDRPKHPGWDYTPLCLAKSVEVAELLKAAGANIHAKLFQRDVSILTYVAYFNGARMVKWFLAQGLDPRMIGDNQQNLLFDTGNAETMTLLLEAGVDPNHVDEFGRTPIMEARDEGSVAALLKHGAKVTGFDEPLLPKMAHSASGPAMEAVIQAGAEVTPEILERIMVSAAHTDRPDVARVALKHGVDPNKALKWDTEGRIVNVPLLTCCVHGSPETAKVLLEHGADPNGGDKPGRLLRTALRNGYKDVAAILRQKGTAGVSELEYAVSTEDAVKVSALLANPPDYSTAPEFWGETLSAAARIGNLEVVKSALAHGAPLSSKEDKTRVGAMHNAAFEGQHEVLELLLAAGPKPQPAELQKALWSAVWNSNPYDKQRSAEHFEKTVAMLLAAGAPANAADAEENLMLAAVFTRNPGGNPRVIEMLVKAGAELNPTVKSGEKDIRLMEAMDEVCKTGGCSVPTTAVLRKLNELAGAAGK